MKRFLLSTFFGLILTAVLSPAVFAYESPGSYDGYINDFADIIPIEQEEILEMKLSDFESNTSNEVAVVTIDSLGDDTIENFAFELFQEWGIGKADKDNGVLFLVAPNDREVRIEVGYGLEGDLTDLESHSIIQNIIIPSFKVEDYENGIILGVDAIFEAATSEYNYLAPSQESKGEFDLKWTIIAISIFILVIILIIYLAKKYGGRGGGGSSYYSGSSGSGGSSSFGGGSSGGGGASGSW